METGVQHSHRKRVDSRQGKLTLQTRYPSINILGWLTDRRYPLTRAGGAQVLGSAPRRAKSELSLMSTCYLEGDQELAEFATIFVQGLRKFLSFYALQRIIVKPRHVPIPIRAW